MNTIAIAVTNIDPLIEPWEIAFAEANSAEQLGEVPIGCAIVDAQGQLLARAGNRVEIRRDACAHAEMLAIQIASQKLSNWRLDGCKLYVTLEPCPMCAGAILNSRIAELHYAAPDLRLGACGSTMNLLANNPIDRHIQIYSGTNALRSISMLKSFFQGLRQRNKVRKKGNGV